MRKLSLCLIGLSILAACSKEKSNEITTPNGGTGNDTTKISKNIFVDAPLNQTISPGLSDTVTITAVFDQSSPSYFIASDYSVNGGAYMRKDYGAFADGGTITRHGDTITHTNAPIVFPDIEGTIKVRVYGAYSVGTQPLVGMTDTITLTYNSTNSAIQFKEYGSRKLITNPQTNEARGFNLIMVQPSGDQATADIFYAGSNVNQLNIKASKLKVLSIDSTAFFAIKSVNDLKQVAADSTGYTGSFKPKKGDIFRFETYSSNDGYGRVLRAKRSAVGFVRETYNNPNSSTLQAYVIVDIKYLY